MGKRILITCTDSMMKQFLEPHVRYLIKNGYDVEIACSEVLSRLKEIQEDLGAYVPIHKLNLRRSPLSPINLKGYFELRNLLEKGNFDLVWTNEPVMGVLTRIAARNVRKRGTKVLYMVHGFHFYDGAPFFSWLIYYPIESVMARFTDVVCTINQEDFRRASRMGFPKVAYIHGIGVDTERFQQKRGTTDIRKELNLSDDAFLVLSVGELNKNKNQQIVLRAIATLRDQGVHYILCGKGNFRERLERLAQKLGLAQNVHFLGYRNDVDEVYLQADVFVQPSWREGLGLAVLEAAWNKIPTIISTACGATDLIKDGISGFVNRPNDPEGFAQSIKKFRQNPTLRRQMANRAKELARPFVVEYTRNEVIELFSEMLASNNRR